MLCCFGNGRLVPYVQLAVSTPQNSLCESLFVYRGWGGSTFSEPMNIRTPGAAARKCLRLFYCDQVIREGYRQHLERDDFSSNHHPALSFV
jgi:hypothetical protein